MNKLPQITLAFWVMKICATTLGETAGDLLSMTLNGLRHQFVNLDKRVRADPGHSADGENL